MTSANHTASRIENDPQMQVFRQPRLVEDFVQIPGHSQLMIMDGGIKPVILRGNSVNHLLPKLLPLLDGRRTIDEIIDLIPGFTAKAVKDAIAFLYMQGLLEEGVISSMNLTREMVNAFQSTLKFYSRHIDDTRVSANRYEVLSHLQSAHVVLVADSDAAWQLAYELGAMGVGHLHVYALNDRDDAWQQWGQQQPFMDVQVIPAMSDEEAIFTYIEQNVHQPDREQVNPFQDVAHQVIVMLMEQPRPELEKQFNRMAKAYHMPLMRTLIHDTHLEIGPAYFPNESACLVCAHQQEALLTSVPETAPYTDNIDSARQIIISQTALSLLSVLAKLTPVQIANVVIRLDPVTMEWKHTAIHRMPGCPACGTIKNYTQGRDFAMGEDHYENLTALYHFNSNDRRFTLYQKGHQIHYSDKTMKAVGGAYKHYSSHPKVNLPYITQLPAHWKEPFNNTVGTAEPVPNGRSLDIFSRVAMLLGVAAGRSNLALSGDWSVGLRVTPSAGGMASQTLYLVNFDIPSIEQGVYHCNPQGFLEFLRLGDFYETVSQAVVTPDEPVKRPLAVLVQTAAMMRVETKYRQKSYRYVLLDAGAMLHSLQYVSQLVGLPLYQSMNFYDDEIDALLGLNTISEFAVSVLYVMPPSEG